MKREELTSAKANPYFSDHESVYHFTDETVGLNAIIAVHSTALGPSMGGVRVVEFADVFGDDIDSALSNALNLSKGMSLKNSASELPIGGGKAVVILAKGQKKTPELMRAFGDAVESLGQEYITAEDMGVGESDMEQIATRSKFVSGLPAPEGTVGGNPSPHTAKGVFFSMKEAVKYKLGRDDFNGLKVAIQGGAGSVASSLCHLLHAEGAKIIISDTHEGNIAKLVAEIPEIEVVGLDEIHKVEADIYSPCAIGGTLNEETIPEIKAKIIVGAANNQLARPHKHATNLAMRDILYVPDFIVNAGGIICCAVEYFNRNGHNDFAIKTEADLEAAIAKIGTRTKEILQQAHAKKISPQEYALLYAEEIIAEKQQQAA